MRIENAEPRAIRSMRAIMRRESMPALPLDAGGRAITSPSAGSKANAMVRKPSERTLCQRICTGRSGKGSPKARAVPMRIISVKPVDTRCTTTFLRLSKIRLPSSIAETMTPKSLETSTISAASRATSLPLPSAIPMSAATRAGVSLTPSPVMATTSP